MSNYTIRHTLKEGGDWIYLHADDNKEYRTLFKNSDYHTIEGYLYGRSIQFATHDKIRYNRQYYAAALVKKLEKEYEK